MVSTVTSRYLEALVLQEEERRGWSKHIPSTPEGLQSAISDTQGEIAKAFAKTKMRRIRARPSNRLAPA